MTTSVPLQIGQRPLDHETSGAVSTWLVPGAWRTHGVHQEERAARRRRRFLRLIAILTWPVRIIGVTARDHGWSLAWPAALTVSGFTVNATVGWAVLALGCLWMDLRTGKAGGPPTG